MRNKIDRSVRRLIACSCLALAAGGCFMLDILERRRQLRTYVNMQAIVGRLEQLRSEGSKISDAQISAVIGSRAGGYDEWGHRLLFRKKPSGQSFSYVLVSFGKDGKPDPKDTEAYFHMPEVRIHGQAERDIVFRDGASISKAGK